MDDMNENVSWLFEKQDALRPRLCPLCGDAMEVAWRDDGYDYGCARLACAQLYYGPPPTEAELSGHSLIDMAVPNCPRCLMRMEIVPDGDSFKYGCRQDGCDGIWPPPR